MTLDLSEENDHVCIMIHYLCGGNLFITPTNFQLNSLDIIK